MLDLFSGIWDFIKNIRIFDVIDIAIVSFIVYKLLGLLRETRAKQIIKGVVVIAIAYLIASALNLYLLSNIIQLILSNGVIAIVILFQPELRHALEQVGRTKFSQLFARGNAGDERAEQIDAINGVCEGLRTLADMHMGALVVFERETKLGDIVSTGTIIDASITPNLVSNVFFNKAPLHDGAMIIRNNKVYAAGCILPLTQHHDTSMRFGTRHRAAIGMSENSDAVVAVLSEERGTLSLAVSGELITYPTHAEFLSTLYDLLVIPEKTDSSEKKFSFSSLSDSLKKRSFNSDSNEKEETK